MYVQPSPQIQAALTLFFLPAPFPSPFPVSPHVPVDYSSSRRRPPRDSHGDDERLGPCGLRRSGSRIDKVYRRRQVIELANRITSAVRNNDYLLRWLALTQERRQSILVERFRLDALDAANDRHPNLRLQTPELVLANLLQDNGQGFADLAESLCYLRYSGHEDVEAERFPIVNHRSGSVSSVPPTTSTARASGGRTSRSTSFAVITR